MSELTIWTLDWVPEVPRGFVRDLRLRWAARRQPRGASRRVGAWGGGAGEPEIAPGGD